MIDEFFSHAQKLQAEGVPFATATVVRAERPTSGKPGDRAVITLDGVMHGWIGGSCAQPTVVRESLRALADDRSRLVRLTPNPDPENAPEGVEVCKMTCYSGGTLDIFIEPQPPQPELRIAGHLPVAQALATLAKNLGYRVTAVVTPGEQPSMARADAVSTRWSDLAAPATPLTFVVVATHGHDDEEALEHALESGAGYVGLVASPKRAENVRSYLKLRGLEAADLDARLEAPAGLDLGARRGEEIALSILAEIVQRRRLTTDLEWELPVADEVKAGALKAAEVKTDEVRAGKVKAGEGEPAVEKAGAASCCGGTST
ncbi:MAG: XdhC family protein [Acidobacteriota bacterium]